MEDSPRYPSSKGANVATRSFRCQISQADLGGTAKAGTPNDIALHDLPNGKATQKPNGKGPPNGNIVQVEALNSTAVSVAILNG